MSLKLRHTKETCLQSFWPLLCPKHLYIIFKLFSSFQFYFSIVISPNFLLTAQFLQVIWLTPSLTVSLVNIWLVSIPHICMKFVKSRVSWVHRHVDVSSIHVFWHLIFHFAVCHLYPALYPSLNAPCHHCICKYEMFKLSASLFVLEYEAWLLVFFGNAVSVI